MERAQDGSRREIHQPDKQEQVGTGLLRHRRPARLHPLPLQTPDAGGRGLHGIYLQRTALVSTRWPALRVQPPRGKVPRREPAGVPHQPGRLVPLGQPDVQVRRDLYAETVLRHQHQPAGNRLSQPDALHNTNGRLLWQPQPGKQQATSAHTDLRTHRNKDKLSAHTIVLPVE